MPLPFNNTALSKLRGIVKSHFRQGEAEDGLPRAKNSDRGFPEFQGHVPFPGRVFRNLPGAVACQG